MARKDARVQLTAREREIVISAIAARVSGSPSDAAKQVLTAIAVLDGDREPLILWPQSISRVRMAAWHESEAVYWRESAARFAPAVSLAAQSADRDRASAQTDEPIVSAETPLAHSV
ncbi:hypothetical protein D3C77_319990 [compost metagenome]